MVGNGTLDIAELLERNKDYAKTTHKALPPLLTMLGGSFENGPHILIISCLDSRTNPCDYLQTNAREVIVIRNVGGRVKSALSNILALDTQFGLTQIVMVQHSDCGSSHSPVAVVGGVKSHVETRTESEDGEMWDREIHEYVSARDEQRVKSDLEFLRGQAQIRKELRESAVGFWLDVETGLLKQIQG